MNPKQMRDREIAEAIIDEYLSTSYAGGDGRLDATAKLTELLAPERLDARVLIENCKKFILPFSHGCTNPACQQLHCCSSKAVLDSIYQWEEKNK